MRISLAILCDHANVSHDGKLNVLGVFNTLNVTQLPAVHPQMHFVLTFEADFVEAGGEHALQIRCTAPSGENLFKLDSALKIGNQAPGPRMRHNQILGLNNLKFEEAGDHTFIVNVDGETLTETLLDVRMTGPAGPGIAQA